jgi:hypothetical protein
MALNQFPVVQTSSCNDLSRKTAGTPLGAIGRGLVAGAAGSLAMDVLWYVRYPARRRQTALLRLGVLLWPVQLGRSAGARASRQSPVRRALPEETSAATAELVSNITHWAYGMLNGALYGIAAESLGQLRT